MSANKDCKHDGAFDVHTNIARILKNEGDTVPHRYQADIRIACAECGLPFRFIGLPAGVDMSGAAVSIDGEEGRFSILPRGMVLTPLESTECGGFTVRKAQ